MELGLRVAFVETPARFNADFLCLIPSEIRKWTPLLAECAELCQYYFSIFETVDYMGLRGQYRPAATAQNSTPAVVPSQKARNSRVASRVPALLFSNFLTYRHGVGRGCGVGRGLGVTLGVGETDGVGVGLAGGGVTVGVGVGVTGGAVGVGDGEAHGGIS